MSRGRRLTGAALGVWFAVDGATPPLIEAHYRLTLVGFLGLTIVGVSYQFYPPAVGTIRGVGDRTALVSIGAIATGLALEVGGLVAGVAPVATLDRVGALLGATLYASLVLSLFWERHRCDSARA